MAGSKSTYWANNVATQVAGKTLYVALLDTSGVELSYSGYARQSVTAGSVASGSFSNTNDIVFPVNGGSSVTIGKIALYDALTVGNQLYTDTLGTSVPLGTNQKYELPVGQVTITES